MSSIFQSLRDEQERPPDATTVECPKCSTANPPGAARCANCRASLRPLILAILTISWSLGSVFHVALAAVMAATLDLWHFEQSDKLVFDAEEDMLPMLALLSGLAAVPVPFGLRIGRYWAWVAVQGVFLLSVMLHLLWGVEHFTGHPLAVALRVGVHVLLMALLWRYIRSDRVDAFCSVGRSVPLSTIGLWAAAGALLGAVVGYLGAGVVDGETALRLAASLGVKDLVPADFVEANLRIFAAALAASIGAAALCEVAVRKR